MKKGIDVAKWQGVVDWGQVRAAGVEFVVLKIIDKNCNTESAFEYNFSGVVSQGLPVGVYNYSYASTVKKAKSDARKVLDILSGRQLQCGVWLDVEDKRQQGLGPKLTDISNAYKEMIESAGYKFGIYTGLSFYDSYFRPYANLVNSPFWIARYPTGKTMHINNDPAADKKPLIMHPLWGWQYSSNGRVPGIGGSVDLNILHEDVESENSYGRIKNPYREPDYTLYRFRPDMSAEHVRWLQYELNETGCGLTVDGQFGPATDAALRNVQKRFGITADGRCGAVTRNRFKTVKVNN